MEENKLTAKEIFEQLTILQRQLTENSYTSLHRLGDAISSVAEDEEENVPSEQITFICDVFKARERTLFKLLEMYEKMYDDIQKAEKVNLIKTAFDNNMSFIEAADIQDDNVKGNTLAHVTDKIAELIEMIITEEN